MNKLQQIGLSLTICFLGSLSLFTTGVQASSATAHQHMQVSYGPVETTPPPDTITTPSQPDVTGESNQAPHIPTTPSQSNITGENNHTSQFPTIPSQFNITGENNHTSQFPTIPSQFNITGENNHTSQFPTILTPIHNLEAEHNYPNNSHEQYYNGNQMHHSQNTWYDSGEHPILIPQDPSLIGRSLIGNSYPQYSNSQHFLGSQHTIVVIVIALVIIPITPISTFPSSSWENVA